MENIQELIQFAKEIRSQKPSNGMVKVYLVGSMLALFGVMIGFVEIVLQPFYTPEPMDEEITQLVLLEQQEAEKKLRWRMEAAAVLEEDLGSKTRQQAMLARRNSANRLHAS
uniref:G0/G1 switch 2 n=1 Tax=Paramormyrops kingsleyae TaxID=1676925 RepID=A0A3B3T1N0_9TELE|nr:G0/G1 switch protein 2-like [Paramormyrops kingsleyae]